MEFLIRNSRYVSGEVKNVDDDHDTFIERFQEDVIDQRRHHTKGMVKQKVTITIDKMPSQNSELSLKTNNMMRKVRCKLRALSGLCPEDEGHR